MTPPKSVSPPRDGQTADAPSGIVAVQQAPTIGTARRAAIQALRAGGVPDAAQDARILLAHAAQVDSAQAAFADAVAITPAVAETLATAITRRLAGEPTTRITGVRGFMDVMLDITPDVLDPRPDTEVIVDRVVHAAAHWPRDGSDGGREQRPLLLDLGTGSGAITVGALTQAPLAHWHGIGTDISLPALRVARRNAVANGLAARTAWVCGDWLTCFQSTARAAIIVSNPPYICSNEIDTLDREVRCHDPRAALDGGHDGLTAYRAIIGAAAPRLLPGGHLILEIGADQAPDVGNLITGMSEARGLS
ncbi:MAG: peptide chain release factor N(5)-glutamine methyltransferase, partial [Pseudomonadota bacterium]